MKFDPTKPVQLRDGSKARVICHDAKGPYPIVALHFTPEGTEAETRHDSNGFLYRPDNLSPFDLVNIPEERVLEGWVNVYESDLSKPYTTWELATHCAGKDRIACVEIKQAYKVGEGL